MQVSRGGGRGLYLGRLPVSVFPLPLLALQCLFRITISHAVYRRGTRSRQPRILAHGPYAESSASGPQSHCCEYSRETETLVKTCGAETEAFHCIM